MEIVLALLAVGGLFWWGAYARYGSLWIGAAAFIALGYVLAPQLWTAHVGPIPLTIDRDNPNDQAKLKLARHREFIFGRSDGTDEAPWTVKTDGGFGYNMDPRRISAAPQLASGPTKAGFSGDGTAEIRL